LVQGTEKIKQTAALLHQPLALMKEALALMQQPLAQMFMISTHPILTAF
jgi:hypothetical protein